MSMKDIIAAGVIGTVSAVSMTFLFNNLPGTNNKLAAISGSITAVSYLILKEFKVV